MHVFPPCILICCVPLPLCLSRGKKPICAPRPQLETHPAQAFFFWKTLRSLRRLNVLSKHLPSPGASTAPLCMFTPDPEASALLIHKSPGFSALSWAFSAELWLLLHPAPLHEFFQRIHQESCSPLTLYLVHLSIRSESTAQQDLDHIYFCSAPLMRL